MLLWQLPSVVGPSTVRRSDGSSAPAPIRPLRLHFLLLLLRSFSRPETGAMTSSPSVTIILVYVAAASYLVYWVGLMGIHLIAILYG